METVCILMSTYNGSKYVAEQLDSLLTQTSVKVEIIIRDDGSSDNTVDILKKYENMNKNITVYEGENIGYERSFYNLMKCADNYNYYAFSDQDDVWDEDKLIVAIIAIKLKETHNSKNNIGCSPIIYWCNLRIVNAELKYMCDMKAPDDLDFKKGRYLIDKYGYGCTMVFNEPMRDLAVHYEPKTKISHDNWVGILGIFLGDYIFDVETHISYRQHGNNVVGGNNGWIGKWKRRIKALKNIKQYSRASIAQEIVNGYLDVLTDEDLKLLELVANYKASFKNKLYLINNKEISRKSKEKQIWFEIMIVLSLA